jgi:hypothetical protein
MVGTGQFFSLVRERISTIQQAVQARRLATAERKKAAAEARYKALPEHQQRLITAAAMGCPREVYHGSLLGHTQHPDRPYWDSRLRDVFRD